MVKGFAGSARRQGANIAADPAEFGFEVPVDAVVDTLAVDTLVVGTVAGPAELAVQQAVKAYSCRQQNSGRPWHAKRDVLSSRLLSSGSVAMSRKGAEHLGQDHHRR